MSTRDETQEIAFHDADIQGQLVPGAEQGHAFWAGVRRAG